MKNVVSFLSIDADAPKSTIDVLYNYLMDNSIGNRNGNTIFRNAHHKIIEAKANHIQWEEFIVDKIRVNFCGYSKVNNMAIKEIDEMSNPEAVKFKSLHNHKIIITIHHIDNIDKTQSILKGISDLLKKENKIEEYLLSNFQLRHDMGNGIKKEIHDPIFETLWEGNFLSKEPQRDKILKTILDEQV